jgi:small-conductance mechanosensitive channel
MIPNSKILLESVENKTKDDPLVRVQLSIFLYHTVDLPQVEQLLNATTAAFEGYVASRKPQMGVSSITQDGIVIDYKFFVEDIKFANSKLATKILYSTLRDNGFIKL